jgi:serine/threonine-protein kinase
VIGQSLGSYSIQRELGRGGMGAVYVGYHALLGRPAAIKVLLPQYSQNQEIVQRFFNEARAATAIRHPGIVEVYDFGFATDGAAYIVMELCDGESLAARLRRMRTLPVATALGFARQIAGALAAAHKAGIVHRDLKPDNVFLVPDAEVAGGERIKLLDFGIAKLAGDGGGGQGMMARTSTGALMGTPYYMSPEQCRGAGQVDHRSDLYSLGCILFEMVCGQVPFVGEGVGDIIGAHLHVAPPAPRSLAPELPPAAEALILGLLAKKPDQRIASADAVVSEIRRMWSGEVSGGYPLAAPAPVSGPMPAAPMPTPAPMHTPGPAAVPMAPTVSTTLGAAAAQVEPPPRRRSSKTPWIAGGALVAVGAVAAIAIATGGSGGHKGGSGSASAAAVTIDAAAMAAAPPDATVVTYEAPAPAAGPPPQAGSPDAALPAPYDGEVASCEDDRQRQDWTALAQCATVLARMDPKRPEAKTFGDVAKREMIASLRVQDLRDALAADHYADAKKICDALPGDSVTAAQALELCAKANAGAHSSGTGTGYGVNPLPEGQMGRKISDHSSTPAPPAAAQVVTPGSITLVAGTKAVEPDDPTKQELQRAGKNTVVATYKLCLDAAGAPSSVTRLKSSGFDAYDAKIDRALHAWKAKPYMVNGAAVAVCTAETFIYKMSAASEPTTPPDNASSSPDCADANQLLDDGRAAAKNTQWGKVMGLCGRVLQCNPGNAEAVMLCALAACNVKNAAKAKAYISRLPASRQSMARQSCLRNGVDPGGGDAGDGGESTAPSGVAHRTSGSVGDVVRKHRAAFEACYNRALKANPNLRGRVIFDLQINAAGKVTSASFTENELNDEAGACMLSVAHRLLFSPSDNDDGEYETGLDFGM